MYASFFGLRREPFSIAPDPRYLFMSERHREALAHLLYGLNAGGGFVLLTGEIGAGKTTVCRCFLEQIPKRCNVAYIFNPKLTVEELLRSICHEFGVPLPAANGGTPPTVKDHVDPLNEFLLKTHSVGQNNVLIIDEAQMLSADVLEQLRLLTNLETNERKLLQIVLIGQPELRDKLARPELEQLAQRVVARFHLDALSPAETARYIAHRLAVGGIGSQRPFDAAAIRQIHRLSGGVPRRINLLCDRALLGAYAGGRARVDRRIVERAAIEVFGSARDRTPRAMPLRRWAMVGGLLGGATLLGVAASAWLAPPRKPVAAVPAPRAAASVASVATRAPATVPLPRPAAAASAVAGVVAPAAAPTPSASADAATLLAALPRSENEAWRAMARLWQLAAADGDPCQAAARQQVQCFRGKAPPSLIRRLNRPGIVTLRDAAGRPAYALLVGLDDQAATFRVAGGGLQTVPLAQLARWWRGDFATLWRAPAGYNTAMRDGSTGPAIDWLSTQLAGWRREPPPPLPRVLDAALREQLVSFQIANELRPDGVVSPMTFMQINRAAGVDEPHLLASASAP